MDSQPRRRTNLTTENVRAVLHSYTEGDDDNCDPRSKAAMINNILYEREHGLPDGTVWCHDALDEIARFEGKRK